MQIMNEHMRTVFRTIEIRTFWILVYNVSIWLWGKMAFK